MLKRLILLIFVSASLLACQKTVPVTPDFFTISGRYQLAKADPSNFQKEMIVSKVSATEKAFKWLRLPKGSESQFIQDALNKSLANHGYSEWRKKYEQKNNDELVVESHVVENVEILEMGNSHRLIAYVDVDVEPLEAGKQKATVSIELRSDESDAYRCDFALNKAEFVGVPFENTESGARTAAFVAGVALAALSGAAGGNGRIASDWLQTVNHTIDVEETLHNEKRNVLVGEAVAAGSSPDAVASFAARQALKLAMLQTIKNMEVSKPCTSLPAE